MWRQASFRLRRHGLHIRRHVVSYSTATIRHVFICTSIFINNVDSLFGRVFAGCDLGQQHMAFVGVLSTSLARWWEADVYGDGFRIGTTSVLPGLGHGPGPLRNSSRAIMYGMTMGQEPL